MKQLVEYSVKSLYDTFKPEEVCFVVEKSYDNIDELSYIADDLDDALSEAKENDYKIFIYTKKFARDCLDTRRIFEDVLEDLEEEGLDRSYVLDHTKRSGRKEFAKLINRWFNKYIDKTYWFTDRLLGTLKLDTRDR